MGGRSRLQPATCPRPCQLVRQQGEGRDGSGGERHQGDHRGGQAAAAQGGPETWIAAMSGHDDARRRAQFAAMALLVTDGVIDRRDAIGALTYHQDTAPKPKSVRDQFPPGYGTARSMARMVDRGAIDYREAELNVALTITGGSDGEGLGDAMDLAGRLLGIAVGQIDKLRSRTADQLQDAILSQKAPVAAVVEAVETPKALPGSMAPRPIMRRPVRHP